MSDDPRTIPELLEAMNDCIADAMGMGCCSDCGDALVWNYEVSAGLCYRCQDK